MVELEHSRALCINENILTSVICSNGKGLKRSIYVSLISIETSPPKLKTYADRGESNSLCTACHHGEWCWQMPSNFSDLKAPLKLSGHGQVGPEVNWAFLRNTGQNSE